MMVEAVAKLSKPKKMKPLLTFILMLCLWTIGAQKMNHSEWTKILQLHVSESGEVNYKEFNNNRRSLENYLDNLANHPPQDHWSLTETKAYWINAYNAYTIQLILDNYPLKSIKDINDPWGQTFFKINGETMSLNAIEHEILRPMGDPQIHFAIVCASESCPKLLNYAYEPETLNDQLDQAAKEFINDASKNNITASQITISKIFKWFKSDFPKGAAFITYLNNYSALKIHPDTKINYQNYNWSLNE